MDEIDFKVEVLAWVRRASRGRALPVIASEFSLNGTGIRADLAVLSDCFLGVEIKSASDTLKRLPSQMDGYSRYFDQTILVVASKHEAGLETLNLCGAQVWTYRQPDGLACLTQGKPNDVVGHTLLGLLTAEEERRAIKRLATGADVHEAARCEFETAFKQRYAATSAKFWEAVRGRTIRRDDLTILSRFHEQRVQGRIAAAEEERRWVAWAARVAVAGPDHPPFQSSSVS
ncbi:hypothetical protein [Sphingomonas sp. Leaf231]|uniref:hypothetical protein n=1 Tax=Sphingomonas sp. Leaf231 TaxID=1736301 RepID=UPI000B31F2EF|nr:hypothetical protein [Sphingomonas sp. Leaf231]